MNAPMTSSVLTHPAVDAPPDSARSAYPGSGSRWTLVVRTVLRQRSRNLLMGLLILFASFVIVFFSQFLEGVSRNFAQNMIALASGEAYVSSKVERSTDRNIFDRDYDYFTLSPAFYQGLAAVPGYAATSARLEFDAKLVFSDNSVQQRIMAFDLASEAKLRDNFRFVEGRMFRSGEYGVVLPVDFARRHGIRVGDRVRLLARAVSQQINLIDFTVTGLFTTANLSAWFDNYGYLDLPVARVLVDDPGALTRLNIKLDDGAALEASRAAVAALLKANKNAANPALDTTTWGEGAAFFTELTAAMKLSYAIVIAIVIVMVAASLAFSTMMNILERTKEIATLGALGAPPHVIRRLLVAENLLLAVVAASAGTLCAGLAFLITARVGIPIGVKELSGFLGSSHFYPAFSPSGFAAGLLVPPVVAFLASFVFAGRAAKLPIAAAIADR
jgi:putative ABC transport system permease protein